MKASKRVISIILFIICAFSLSSCDLFLNLINKITGNDNSIDTEFTAATGKWELMDDNKTYFSFDGSKNVMTYQYYQDDILKYEGTFRAINKGVGNDVLTPLTFIFSRTDKSNEDWISCYVDDFDTAFTQFTIMEEEEDLGVIDGTVYTHIYRISELPYIMGTYILSNNKYKVEKDNYSTKDQFCIPNGTYTLQTGESFTFLYTKPRNSELFQYKKDDIIIEGLIQIAADKNTIYLYIEHDPYQKVKNEDKEHYDTTFSQNYPPDFYLRGDFSNSEYIIINDLYHHSESPTTIKDSTWTFGTYNR